MDMNGKPGWQSNRGVAVLELAFTLIFLLLLTVGITEIGRSFWYYSALQTAVRNGARCLSTQKWISSAPVVDCQNLVVNDANSAGLWPQFKPANATLHCDGAPCNWGNGAVPEYVGIHTENYTMHWIWWPIGLTPPTGNWVALKVVATMPYMK